jgi:GT2 family glycosyltransferase
MDPESQPPAPAVVAVVVTCDPGPWFEQVLTSLAAQDYPNMSVLVVDAASAQDPTPTVSAVLPGAFVQRLPERVGFGSAANEVRRLVAGASHYLLCHDDVVLASDALRLLVEEAFRSNSGITSPKFVQWDAPERLLAVGATTDKVGVMHDIIDPGELDQEQHDAVREVLVAPSGATLVRADLFEALGGFDEVIDELGEDVDLSWRARVLGARVTVVPSARVMHLQASRRGLRPGTRSAASRVRAERSRDSHRIRTLLTCYGWYDLLWALPLALLWLLGESATRLLQGRPGDAWWALASYFRGFSNPGGVLRARRSLQRNRQAGDRALRRLQSRGNARFRTFVRARIDDVREGMPPAPTARRVVPTGYEDPGEVPGPVLPGGGPEEMGPAPVATDRRLATLILAGLALLLVVGTRSLFGHELPGVGHLPNTSSGIGSLWRGWWSTWQQTGVGVAAPAPPALGLLAVLGTILGGAVGTLQHVVVLAPLALGPFGAYRAARWWGSRRGRLAAALVYAVCPIAYNSLAAGHWGALVAYGAAPWLLGMVGRLSGQAPFPVTDSSRIKGRVLGISLLVALVGAVSPSFLYVVPLLAVGVLAGSALAGRPSSGLRAAGISVASAVIAALLLLPWSGTVLGSAVATLGPDPGPAARLGLGAVMRFQTGPFGGTVLGWALLLVAALPLFIGRGWRLVWAARLWSAALVCFATAWMSSRGWVPQMPPDVVLTMAAACLALSAALGAVAFELDLPGYRFGWRQLAAGVAGASMLAAAIPLFGAAAGGRWKVPSADAASVLGFALADPHHGDYRVLWVGAPNALPLAGYQMQPGLSFATSFDGEPGAADLWVSGRQGSVAELASDLRLIADRSTTKAGHLLAVAGVRYLVIPNRISPAGSGGVAVPVPQALIQGMKLQTDLQALNVDPAYSVYVNAAWQPVTALLSPQVAAVAAGAAAGAAPGKSPSASNSASTGRQIQQLDLAGDRPALVAAAAGGVSRPARGALPRAASTVYVGSTRDSGWTLRVGSHSISPKPAFGWAMRFEVPAAAAKSAPPPPVPLGQGNEAALAEATLHPPTSVGILVTQTVEVAAWLALAGIAMWDLRRRRREEPDPEVVRPEWFTPVSPAVDRRNWRKASQALGAQDMEGEEVWIDV